MSRREREPLELNGRQVLVMGLGAHQGGIGVTRYLVSQGAEVTVTDLRPPEALESSLAALRDLPVTYRLGEHRAEDFDAAEMIVRNPAVPRDSQWLRGARDRGVPVEMEMSLFFRACPAPIIGITGTKGKTTTATLCARILRRSRPDTVLAGNMGMSALGQLDKIGETTPVVLELSSWQLEGLADYRLSPEIAVLTNISEDHLNRYDSMDDYREAKRHITRFQGSNDWFIVNRDDPACWQMSSTTSAQVAPFGSVARGDLGATVDEGAVVWQAGGDRWAILPLSDLPFRGAHALQNALAATAASIIAGASIEDVRNGLSAAEPVPHRQELVATVDGVDYINDTTATAPAAAIAALNTFAGRQIVLIAGGASKGASLDAFAEIAARQADAIVLLDGDETENLRQLLDSAGTRLLSDPLRSMADAVAQAREWAAPGGVVLLSPACASFGLFRDEFDRGEQFRRAVTDLSRPEAGGTR